MKSNVTALEEEMRRFPGRYIDSVKSPDGCVLRSNREILSHFRDRLARCPDLPLQEFRSYLADFPLLGAAEVVCCEGVVIECEVSDALKQVDLNKSPRLDGLLYEVYLRHICAYSGGYVQPLVLPGEPFLVTLPKAWSHCWRKVPRMLGRD